MKQLPNLQNVKLELTVGDPSGFPRSELPQIVFSGRSNVGKSSLINSLLGRKSLARVSSAPGKTVTVNFYNVDGKLYLVDLPGYGFARRTSDIKQRFSSLTDSYLTEYNPLRRTVIQLVDLRVGPTEDDLMMLNWIGASGLPYVIVATKADKLNRTEREAAERKLALNTEKYICFSSVTGEGRDAVRRFVFDFCAGN